MDTSQLLLGVLFSSIGFGYFIYGKTQKVIVPFICGLMLMVFPYFIESGWLILLIGTALSIAPRFIRF